MRSLGWILIQYNWCPYFKIRGGTRYRYTSMEGGLVKRHRERGGIYQPE